MEEKMKKHYCILLLIFMMACGSQETAESEEITASDPVDTVAVVDSIGVLMGDSNYVLGSIADFTTLSGGRPAILDRVKGTVAVFDSTGEFLLDFGGFGEGPGEFQRPFHMAALESGIFVVTQLMAPTLALDSTGGYLGNWQFPGFGGMSLDCMPFDDSSFVCYYFAMQMEETPSITIP